MRGQPRRAEFFQSRHRVSESRLELELRMEDTCSTPSRCTKTHGFARGRFSKVVRLLATESAECPMGGQRGLRTSEHRIGTSGASCESTPTTHKPIGPAITKTSKTH